MSAAQVVKTAPFVCASYLVYFPFIAIKTATARTKITATKTRVSIVFVPFNGITVFSNCTNNYTKD